MSSPLLLSRRAFLKTTTTAAAFASVSLLEAVRGAESPGNQIRVGVMGVSTRGGELSVDCASLPGVEVAYVCDVDERNVAKTVQAVQSKGKQSAVPKGVGDFRRILDDKTVDALVVAAPDHWHAPAAILACAAGKHVYVEKPCCHNPHEGELMVAAARKYKRLVQQGTQRRSWPAIMEGMGKVRSGAIGRVLFTKCWYYGPRGTIGKGKQGAVPAWLDYDLWQGPAPARPYRDNLIHYNWHWFWHWGTGELGNNAVHYLDLCRWGLGVDYPRTVTCSGGKYMFPDDDQETPDTTVASFDFGGTTVSWEQRSWAPHTSQDPKFEVAFYGDKGILTLAGSGYLIHDSKGNQVEQNTGLSGNRIHLQNLVDGIRAGKQLNAEIEEGYKSTLLCHLANIAWRTGHTIHFDPEKRKIAGDRAAEALWKRDYRKGWEPKV